MERVWFTSTSIEMINDIEKSTSADASAPPSASHNNHNFSSILSLCSKVTLDGTNFNDWMRNIKMAIRFEDKEYALEKELIEINEQNATPEELASYKKHYDDTTKRLASWSPLWSLNCRDFMRNIGLLNSLPSCYDQFILAYHLNNSETTLAQLHNLIQTAEAGMKGKGLASTSASAPVLAIGHGKGKKRKEANFFYCNKKRHWKRICPKYLQDIKDGKVKPSSVEDYSRYGYIYLIKHKSETFEKFIEFKHEVENQLGRKIKMLRSDRGREYLSIEFHNYLKECGIVSQLTPPRTPQLNGVAERHGYALETAAHILNLIPTKKVAKTPHEMWTGKVPSLAHIKV
ncbi:hypothetical protein L1887_18752 [Cichorium endivia]|nr:hypothetical protein L1887_18752 [Cichorium endivia]